MPEDLFHAHIGGMDAFARGLKIAAKMIKDGRLEKIVKERYAGWDGPRPEDRARQGRFEELEAYTLEHGEPEVQSGRQELIENILNEYIIKEAGAASTAPAFL